MWPTILCASAVGGLVIWIIVVQIRNRRAGRSGCSCGGNCGACGLNCHSQNENR